MDDVSISKFLVSAKNLWYNKTMQHKKGFTLIEIALFLAITGALFAGIVAGVQNSIFQQRTNDSVQNFMEFLRTAYSETMNVQNLGNGQSNQAIYGKLITFGESQALGSDQQTNNANHIHMYDVIGGIGNEISTSGDALSTLKGLHANVMRKDADDKKVLNGIVESYTPKWGAVIQEPNDNDPFTGSLLIIRHPNSGVVYTFFSGQILEVVENFKTDGDIINIEWDSRDLDFSSGTQVDFCINPTGEAGYPNRPNVRIVANARSGSGVELIPESNDTYVCGRGN